MRMISQSAAFALAFTSLSLGGSAQAQNYVGGYSQPAAVPSGVLSGDVADSEKYRGQRSATALLVQQPGLPDLSRPARRLSQAEAPARRKQDRQRWRFKPVAESSRLRADSAASLAGIPVR